MDALSPFLHNVRVKGSLFSRAELEAPWGLSTEGMDDAIFHVILEGAGWIRLPDTDIDARSFRAGDLLVLPHGHPHAVSDRRGGPVAPLGGAYFEEGTDGLPVVRQRNGGPSTSILCGSFSLDDTCREFLLPLLPPLIHVEGGTAKTAVWLDTTLRLIADEQSAQRPGADILVGRLTDVLFVQVLRSWINGAGDSRRGWLGALSDPQLARALGSMHQNPHEAWTASSLARLAGMSRSAFFAKFTTVVGESPSAYLTRWRMRLARSEMLRSDAGLAEVASRVGYGSEAAFSRAFKKHVGDTPSSWRRNARSTPAPSRPPANPALWSATAA